LSDGVVIVVASIVIL